MPTSYAVQIVDDEITLHRPCFGGDDPLLLYALRSHHENHRAPRPPELGDALLDMGISMFEQAGAVARMARRRPDRLGTHIMTVILLPELGFCMSATGAPGHHSVWGAPQRLMECITDIRPIT
jgi:hypothetical protein